MLDDCVTLGRSGLRVSPLCLGAMTFGEEWGFGVGPEDSFRLIETYLDRGGNFIDTANIYTKGHSEAIIGDYFAPGGPGAGRRDEVVIATKFMGSLLPGDPNGGGGGRKAILRNIEESLRRLRTDHVDLYWAHFPDPHTPLEETMRTLDDLVRDGKVRYIGISDHPAWRCVEASMLARMHGWTTPIAIQIEHSLLERTVEGELIPMARAHGMGVTPWGPLRAGILTGKYRRDSRPEPGTTRVPEDSRFLVERTYEIVDALAAIASARGARPGQVALRWLLDRAGVTSVIVGARRVEQLVENIGALEVTITEEETAQLDALSAPALPFPCGFAERTIGAIQNGSSVNGLRTERWSLSPTGPGDRW